MSNLSNTESFVTKQVIELWQNRPVKQRGRVWTHEQFNLFVVDDTVEAKGFELPWTLLHDRKPREIGPREHEYFSPGSVIYYEELILQMMGNQIISEITNQLSAPPTRYRIGRMLLKKEARDKTTHYTLHYTYAVE